MANRFKAAAPKAKKLYKSGKYKTFAAAMQAALKTTGKKKVGAMKFIEKGETKSTPAKRIIRRNRTKKGFFKSVTTLSGHLSAAKQMIAAMIANAERKKFLATRKTDKKQYQKAINELKIKYRKIK